MIKLVCFTCGKEFYRQEKEVKRTKKLFHNTFCSRNCSAVYGNKHRWENAETAEKMRKNHFVPTGKPKDDLSPFRPYLRRIQLRIKERERKSFSTEPITLEYLKEVWDNQKGICPYTGWEMILPNEAGYEGRYIPNKASVDRIDSSLGYEKNNIEFVCLIANTAKNSWSKETLISFCKAVANNIK